MKAIECESSLQSGGIQVDAVPLKSSLLQKLIEAQARVFDDDVAMTTKCDHRSNETVNVGMPLLQIPVEPIDLVILAVCETVPRSPLTCPGIRPSDRAGPDANCKLLCGANEIGEYPQ